MNPNLSRLLPYPFERLALLKEGVTPPAELRSIMMSVGEPKHAAPDFIINELVNNTSGLGNYPLTRGSEELRTSIATWASRRFKLPEGTLSPDRHVLPVNGTREALFAFAQCVVDSTRNPLVLLPNPFYQIYEGAALLAGAEPWYMNTCDKTDFLPDFDSVPDDVWKRCALVYICSPGNPTGAVLAEDQLQKLIQLADRWDFIIAADECYSEIYADENSRPAGILGAAARLDRDGYERCIAFHSLSKRSNVPGLRSGFVAGDAAIIAQFFRYRTYHGCAMPPPAQAASVKAWSDETHVSHNRDLYREKFSAVLEILSPALDVRQPDGGFYLWPRTPVDDTQFARDLFANYNVTVLPGSFLSRNAHGDNPGANHVRMALVPPLDECIDAAKRILEFTKSL